MASESPDPRQRILLVTGMLGAGKSTALRALEDLGWEAVDNFPLRLFARLVGDEGANQPLAIGFDCRTRDFVPSEVIELVRKLEGREDIVVTTVFLDCAGHELERRFNETRRRHFLAQDMPIATGIAAERELMSPLRRWAEVLIDTTHYTTNDLQQRIREQFAVDPTHAMTVTVSSFAFSRGMPPVADLVFDMRFLDNPHWDPALRELTGRIRGSARTSNATPRSPRPSPGFAISCSKCSRATRPRARATSTSRSAARVAGIGRCLSPKGLPRPCAKAAFRPLCCTATWGRALPT